mgnify:FL=1
MQKYGSSTWKIEVDPKYKSADLDLIANIAHEVAHIVLDIRQVKVSPRQFNEELTDTVAIFGGFGRAIYNGASTDFLKNYKIGYLEENEIIHLGRIKELISKGQPIKKSSPVYVPTKDLINCYACTKKLRINESKTGKRIIKCPVCQMKQLVKFKKNIPGILKFLLLPILFPLYHLQKIIDHNNGF